MNLARVIGNLWATRKQDSLEARKLLLVQFLDRDLRPVGAPVVATDTMGAGPGETVLVITAREAVGAVTGDLDALTAVDAAIVGIIDAVNERTL